MRARGLAQREGRTLPRLGATDPAEARRETRDCLAAAAGVPAAEGADPGFSEPVASLQSGGGRRGRAGTGFWECRQGAVGDGDPAAMDASAGRAMVLPRHPAMAGWAAFCASSWHQKARDEFVGWSADARVANLQRMVNNNRFLLLPGVRVHGLASHVLGLAATRLPGDWEAAYGARPLMAYTYVSPDQRLLSCGRVGALRQANVRIAAGRRREGRRAVGRSRWPPTGRSGCAESRNGRSVSPRKCLRPTIGRNGSTGAERTRTDVPGGA